MMQKLPKYSKYSRHVSEKWNRKKIASETRTNSRAEIDIL